LKVGVLDIDGILIEYPRIWRCGIGKEDYDGDLMSGFEAKR